MTSAFHLKCDDKGPTITVIKSKAGKISGGFTSIPWAGGYNNTADPTAYLFSVDQKTKYMNNGT